MLKALQLKPARLKSKMTSLKLTIELVGTMLGSRLSDLFRPAAEEPFTKSDDGLRSRSDARGLVGPPQGRLGSLGWNRTLKTQRNRGGRESQGGQESKDFPGLKRNSNRL